MTAPRWASRSVRCGRAPSMRTCMSPRRRPAEAAGSPSPWAKSTSSTLATAPTKTAVTPSAYAAVLPSCHRRRPTSKRLARATLRDRGQPGLSPSRRRAARASRGQSCWGCCRGPSAGCALGGRMGEAPVVQSETTLAPRLPAALGFSKAPQYSPAPPVALGRWLSYPLPYLGAPQFGVVCLTTND